MKGPKFARDCEGCERRTPSRWRTLAGRYLCAGCYMASQVIKTSMAKVPVVVQPSSPQAQGAGQAGETITVSAPKKANAPEFDLRHLTGGKG